MQAGMQAKASQGKGKQKLISHHITGPTFLESVYKGEG
jgi:hypothetical protein